MGRVLAVIAALAGGTLLAAGTSSPASEPAAATVCAAPSVTYAGALYRIVRLRASRAALGLRLRRPVSRDTAVLTRHHNCVDVFPCVIGQPCEPPEQPTAVMFRVPVARLAGIPPSVALATDSPSVLYVAAATCADAGRGKRLAACLTRARRPAPVASSPAPAPPAGHGAPVDLESVVRALRGAGLVLVPTGRFPDDLFGTDAHSYSHRFFVYEFATEADAIRVAGTVGATGHDFRTERGVVHVGWIDAPHFYRAGRAIVLYVGHDAETLRILRATLGEQFAGR